MSLQKSSMSNHHDVSYAIFINKYNMTIIMDRLLGGVIDDFNLFRII